MINENLDDRRAQGHEHPLLGCLPPFSTAPSFSASSAISRGSYVRTALPAQAFHQAGHLLSFLIHSFNRLKKGSILCHDLDPKRWTTLTHATMLVL